jgi:signal transduction histidine kinase
MNMNTKLRFKVIALLILLSLIAVFGWQIYWVKGLYDSIWEKTENNIYEAMKMADYKELFMRIDKLKNDDDKRLPEGIAYNTGFNRNEDSTFDEDSTINIIGTSAITLDPTDRLSHYLLELGQMEDKLQILIHQTVDEILPIDIAVYDSLLSVELKERNIDAPFTLRLVQLRDSIPLAYMKISPKDSTAYDFGFDERGYDYPVQPKADQIYRLYIKSPEKIVIRQMGGILLSSALLLLLIILSFAYLLRIILKQKTVEELKTDFTNNVTHELKTPIAVAYAANDVLLNHDSPISEKQKKYMTIIQEQLSRLTSMVEQILTLSVENRSTFKLKPEIVHVNELLPSLMEQHKLKTDKEIFFKTDLPDDLTIYADRTHLYNMISNLIENAVKYTNTQQVHITFSGAVSNSENTFSVTDKGIGISETNQKRIFDKFYRVPHGNLHNVKGYGLGLYYIKDIMSKHHGSVSVVSHPGKGSTFTLHFKNN